MGQALRAQNCPVCAPALLLLENTVRTRATLSGKTPQTLKCELCRTGEELDPFPTWDRFNVALKGTTIKPQILEAAFDCKQGFLG